MRTLLLVGTPLVVGAAARHELHDNRATLVLRDRTHISLTLYINCTEALHRALAPTQSITEFVLASAAMQPREVEQALQRAQRRFVDGVKIIPVDGPALTLANWKWPDVVSSVADLG